MKIQAIIVAGGTGTRLKGNVPKPMVVVGGKPLIAHSLETFEQIPAISGIVVVVHEQCFPGLTEIVRRYRFKKVVRVIPGGPTRGASVLAGLRATDEDTELVAVHDAARPLVTEEVILRALDEARENPAVVVAVAAKSTIKRVDTKTMQVEATLPRETLWEVQTPQVFKRDVLLEAYAKSAGKEFTDDAGLVEHTGVPVKVVAGDYRNIKITTREDLTAAEAFLKTEKSHVT